MGTARDLVAGSGSAPVQERNISCAVHNRTVYSTHQHEAGGSQIWGQALRQTYRRSVVAAMSDAELQQNRRKCTVKLGTRSCRVFRIHDRWQKRRTTDEKWDDVCLENNGTISLSSPQPRVPGDEAHVLTPQREHAIALSIISLLRFALLLASAAWTKGSGLPKGLHRLGTLLLWTSKYSLRQGQGHPGRRSCA